jgi:tetratricopeptide (TPR) repeat protein
MALNNLGRVVRETGDTEGAARHLEESLALRRQLGDKPGICFTLQDLGEVARDRGDYPRAAALMEESLGLKREWDDRVAIAYSLHGLGVVARETADYARAAACFEQSLALRREHGDTALIGATRLEEGLLALATGDAAGAIVALRESLDSLVPLGKRPLLARCLDGLAQVASDPERAARLLGAADGLRVAAGVVAAPIDQAPIEGVAGAARAKIGADRYDAAWTAGRRAPEQVLAEARAVAAAPPPAKGPLASHRF